MVYPIEIKNEREALRISEIAANSEANLSVSYGTVILDPRSLLGLLALVGKKINLIAPDGTNPSYFNALVKKMTTNV